MRSCIHQILATVSLLLICGCAANPKIKDNRAYFESHIPTYREEARFLWNVLSNIEFYRENGYPLSLPISDAFNDYLKKAENGELSKTDFNHFILMFKNEIYNPASYKAGYDKVHACLIQANQAIPVFQAYKLKWGFHIPNNYVVQLTLYGPGGSYDPKTGKVILLTTEGGNFKRGSYPLATILHEAVHIGIHSVVVKRYRLSHWTKERIVDRFVEYHFKNILPNYKMQNIPDKAIDTVLENPNVWDTLPKSIEAFVSTN